MLTVGGSDSGGGAGIQADRQYKCFHSSQPSSSKTIGRQTLLEQKGSLNFGIISDGQIKKRFRNAFLIGRRFRLAHVHFSEGKIIEVATFRRDPELGAPPDVSEPELVSDEEGRSAPPREAHDHPNIYGTPAEDAFRRDTTINGLFYDTITSTIIDYVGGLEDMAQRKVRIIGDPAERFTEDPVRIWRVIRQAARLGFDIEEFGPNTFQVRALPAIFSGGDPAAAVRVVVEEFEEDETPMQSEEENRIIARICKRVAVKAGHTLNAEEQSALLRDLETCQSPRTCPHGRPTMIHLSVDLLERQFGRRGAR